MDKLAEAQIILEIQNWALDIETITEYKNKLDDTRIMGLVIAALENSYDIKIDTLKLSKIIFGVEGGYGHFVMVGEPWIINERSRSGETVALDGKEHILTAKPIICEFEQWLNEGVEIETTNEYRILKKLIIEINPEYKTRKILKGFYHLQRIFFTFPEYIQEELNIYEMVKDINYDLYKLFTIVSYPEKIDYNDEWHYQYHQHQKLWRYKFDKRTNRH